MGRSLAIVWFRRDLRLSDNPALAAALTNHDQILPVFIHAPEEEGAWTAGAASRWWLHHALHDLDRQLGARLLVRRGDSFQVLRELIDQSNAVAVYWNRLYEPDLIARDKLIKAGLRKAGIDVQSFNAALLFEPWELSNKQGKPFKVFTPFWKHLSQRGLPREPFPLPDLRRRLMQRRALDALAAVNISDLDLLPRIAWDEGLGAAWTPSRVGAEARLEEFLSTDLARYAGGRDLPAREDVSRLSPYLHFGQLGPREVVAAAGKASTPAVDFLREVVWREFAHHLLFHFPATTDEPLDARFLALKWRSSTNDLAAWQQGLTGIPLVDAGMRQLWQTGWMHNRVRMIVASFLTKNLLIHWQQGARWFWDTLVDADLANNTMGWQWTAGCGADAAPYFRVFNPVLQGEKFDANGDYVRRYVPELRQLPAKWIHRPWDAPAEVREDAGVELGKNYPEPIVDLKASRQRALDAWGQIK